jgi:hypothetical protein
MPNWQSTVDSSGIIIEYLHFDVIVKVSPMVVLILGLVLKVEPEKMQNGMHGANGSPDDAPATDPPVRVRLAAQPFTSGHAGIFPEIEASPSFKVVAVTPSRRCPQIKVEF